MRAYRKKTPVSRRVKRWVRFDIALIAAGIAVLAVGFARNSVVIYTIGSASTGPQAELETEDGSESAVGGTRRASEPFAAGAPCDAFDERFYFDRRFASFDDRFASAFGSPGDAAGKAGEAGEQANDMLLQQQGLGEHAKRDSAVPRSAAAPVTASRLASLPGERLNSAEAPGFSLPLDPDSRTAIYDIAARTVYLPNGHRLEAHSGLGSRLDDPRYVTTKGQGPTPPNVYNLTLRERLFHGVRAIRLIPADDGKMFGRDGILAHSYMLGPSGQSNGCVSFRNYPAFLTAFLKGEVDRLVVVEHLATKTGAKISAANGS
jgi:hypothetical protein